jgi:hypothetical protein
MTPERRAEIRRWTDRPITARSVAFALAIPLAVAFLTWGARTIGPVVVTNTRYLTDSTRRDTRYTRDSLANVQRDSLLRRVDSRIGAIYCASLPADRQAGCR